MRDLSRFLKLTRHFLSNGEGRDASIVQALQACYFMRSANSGQQALKLAISHGLIDDLSLRIQTPLVRALDDGSIIFDGLTKTFVKKAGPYQVQNVGLFKTFADLRGKHASQL